MAAARKSESLPRVAGRPAPAPSAADRDALCRALLKLRTLEDARLLLQDLCTPAELADMAGRWKVARLLDQGIPYRRIQELTGVSTATITRVARSLQFGSGYRAALNRAGAGTEWRAT
jgi:TrpR-related protein YerC/YecD